MLTAGTRHNIVTEKDPYVRQLLLDSVRVAVADPPIEESLPCLGEVKEDVSMLKVGKTAGNISTELLKAGCETMICGLHAGSPVLLPLTEKSLVGPIWHGKEDQHDWNKYCGITVLIATGKVIVHLLLTQVRSHLLKFQTSEQSGFMFLLTQVRSHLLKFQTSEQSGFMLGKSTTNRIIVLCVLVFHQHEFQQEFLAAYVNLKKMFDSEHRDVLWNFL
ncbi:uncharacterized protein LOC143019046 [Oratosquilla oratoria]|uniref:uncharacterized protein LOC143019046 n=1 Tax=Oratosquilla oratoria TaxID=337810 RepID=UPI003F760E30